MPMAPPSAPTAVLRSPPPARNGKNGRDPLIERGLDVLRELRAEIQDLRQVLVRIRDGKATVTSSAAYIETTKWEMNAIFTRIHEEPVSEEVADSDDIRHFENLWMELVSQPLIAIPGATISPDDQTLQLALCDELCRTLVARLGEKTVPARLNDWLRDAWVGYLLPFHDLFSDEIPELEDRQRLLRFLSAAPGLVVGGMVDPGTGLVYPYHAKRWARRLVCAGLTALYVLVTVGIGLLGTVEEVRTKAGFEPGQLILGWLLLTAGALIHMGVDRSKGGNALGSLPVGHLASAIDARSGVITLKLLMMVFAYFGLLFLGGTDEGGPRLTAFLVGYSLDSFVGIFSSALDRKAAERGKAIEGGLGAGGI